MASTTQRKAMGFAGSRLNNPGCGKLKECGCRRSTIDNANIPHFNSNFSSDGNGINYFGFNKCNGARCKIKCTSNNMLLPLNNFKGRFSTGSFPIMTDEHLDCTSKNIVYLITCRLCQIQYVGETQRDFAVRMREHWDKIRKGDKSQIVYAHFQSDDRHRNTRIEDMLRFQIIEKIRTDNVPNQDQGLIKKRRLERELYWIAKLRTAYPLGLNDKLQALGISGNATDRNFKDFNCFRIANLFDVKPKKNRGRRKAKKKGRVSFDDFEPFKAELEDTFRNNKRLLEGVILKKKRIFLEKFVKSRFFSLLPKEICYILENRLDFTKKLRPSKKKIDSITWKLDFSHKVLDEVNIQSVFFTKEINKLLPNQLQNKNITRPVFSYGRTIGSKILNYNKCLREAQDLSYLDIEGMECDCAQSDFVDSHHGHITTGNLDIIRSNRLKQLCSYGSKFREVPVFNKESMKKSFSKNVDDLIGKLVRKFKIPRGRFTDWKSKFVERVNQRIDTIGRIKRWNAPVLSDIECKKELDRLQNRFVITVVDKAAGNFAFTCKKFYFLRLCQELGIDNAQPGNDTYLFVNRSERELCEELTVKLDRYHAKPKESEMRVAMLYHNPKFHKNPVKFRFIAGNVKVVTSSLDETVAKILKMCKGHFMNLCKKYESHSGIRYCFDIEKSADLKSGLDHFQGNARLISINDFSTLYTLFEHDHLVRNMTWLLDKLSKNSGCQAISVGYESAYWTRDTSKPCTYSLTEIIEMISLLIGESYIKAFGKIFRQTKGIIMGGKSSGWLSDCSLMVDEFKYIDSKVKNQELELARSFKGLNRYRDDCTALNIDNFRDIAREIYPPSLELSQENVDLTQATVLDMSVSISEGRFRTKVYNKTDSFPFNVVTMPFLDSNISTKICYKVFYSQILRYQRLCTFVNDFTDRARSLANTLIQRGYVRNKLAKEFRQVIGNYRSEFERWSIPADSQHWFNNILDNPQINTLTVNTATPLGITPFSQPNPTTVGPRFNTFSQ